ncbi:hypothetical protein D3C87_947490 [compost metagenome]
MSRITTVALVAAALGLAASPAFAQSTSGTINITGSVAPKCSVTAGGGVFNEALGELADANGVLRSITRMDHSFTVACSSASANVTVDADALAITGGPAAPTGYSKSIDFTGEAVVQRAGTTDLTVSNLTTAAATTAPTNAYLANATDNVTISAYGFATTSPTDKLIAGSYSGKVVVTIAPI